MHFRSFQFLVLLLLLMPGVLYGQTPPAGVTPKPAATPTPKSTPVPPANLKDAAKNPTADQIAEGSIIVYGLGYGRIVLNQIRKTSVESGRLSVLNADGRMEQANYQRWTTRGETLSKEKIRLDQEFPTAKFSLIYSGEKTFGVFNDAVFTPREDASRAFENQIFYGIDSLLRYKENESKLELVGKEKIAGVDLHVVDLTDKSGRKIRYYISAKSLRVMMLDYEDAGVKYRRKYYDYNAAQGTLVPFRSVLYSNGKVVEEIEVGTVTYGQKIDDALFALG